MQTQIRNFLTCSVLTLGVVIAAGLGALLFTNVDGWGTLLWGVLVSAGLQLLLGLAFTGAGLLALRALEARSDRRRLTFFTLSALFGAGLLLALPLVSFIQRRGLDLLDAFQTLLLAAGFVGAGLALRLAAARVVQVSSDGPKPYDLPPRPDGGTGRAAARTPPAPVTVTLAQPPRTQAAPAAETARTQPAPRRGGKWKAEYARLVALLDGDEAAARQRIEDEHDLAPDAGAEAWIEEAIRKLLRQRHGL